MPIVLGAAISATVALLAWRLRALTASGGLAATAIGTLVLAFTGWAGATVLGAFFLSTTLVGRAVASAVPAADVAEGAPRDHRQVLANGAAAAIGAAAEVVAPDLGLWLVTVALAAAASDTWATGMGALSPRPPRDILSGREVTPGTSGGVSWFGAVGGLVGGSLVALAGAVAGASRAAALYLVATGLGFAAMLLDSVLGAGPQGRFYCARCDCLTERRVHRCGTKGERREGWAWLDNDAVNAVATTAALAAGALAWRWWGSP